MERKDLIRIGSAVLRESDLEIPIEYKGEIFTMKYPNPVQQSQIEAEIARRLGGYSRESYPTDHLTKVRIMVTIDMLLIPEKSPKWFTSAGLCYDEELLYRLFNGFMDFREQFLQRLKEGFYERSGKGDSA